MEKLIIGGEKTIDYVDIGLSCKIFVFGVLHSFFHLSQIAERPMLSKSLSLRANQSHYKGKVETDVKPSVIVELDALDEQESKDAAELGTL